MKILKINIISLFLVALLSSASISINNTSKVVESTIQKFSDTILKIKNMESVSEEGNDLLNSPYVGGGIQILGEWF